MKVRLFFVFIILFIISDSPSNDSTIQGQKSWRNVNEIPFSSSKLTWKTLAKLNNKILHLLFLNWQKCKWRNWLCLYTEEQKIFFFLSTSKTPLFQWINREIFFMGKSFLHRNSNSDGRNYFNQKPYIRLITFDPGLVI